MWRIIYRIFFPGIFLTLISLLLSFFEYKSYLKKKKRRDRKQLGAAVIFLCFAVLGVMLSAFYSLDLVNKDFVTKSGSYERYYRDQDTSKLTFVENGKREYCHVLWNELKKYNLEEGSKYEYTYAKRTKMLIHIRGK